MIIFCDNCGQKLEPESAYCNVCGEKVHNYKSEIDISRISEHLLKSNKNIIKNNQNTVGVLVLIVCLFFIIYLPYNKTQNTIRELQESQNKLNGITASTTEELRLQKIELAKKELEITKLETNIKNSANLNINSNGSINNTLSPLSPSVVMVFCSSNSNSEDIQTGSGVLYKSSVSDPAPYFVETNLHVVQTEDNSPSVCVFSLYPNYKNTDEYLFFEVSDYKTYKYGVDFVYLIPKITTGEHSGTMADLSKYAKTKTSDTYCKSSNIGEHISILGYPGIGGSSLTATDGIISGFEYTDGVRYIKTSAKIEHGSSGGVAIKDSGCVLGIPTYIETGKAESLGRILDLGTLFNSN